MAKEGFGGQWIEIGRAGKANDSTGIERDLSLDWLKQVIANYAAGNHDAPIVIGHPESDTAPAFGWTSELRLNGDVLEAKFTETDDEFEQLVEGGRYKKRSASFYLDPPNLRHVGFLGAQPPAIKGLRDIKFAEGESFALEETFNLQETQMGLEDKDVEKVTEGVFEKIKNFFKPADGAAPEGGAASFSEADMRSLVTEAVKTAKEELTTSFTEELKKKDDEISDLKTRFDGQAAGSRKAEAIAFVESFPAAKGKHWLKRVGLAEFVERVLEDDAADKESAKAISFSEGEGDEKKEISFSRFEFVKNLLNAIPDQVQFGEKFGELTATKDADPMVDMGRVEAMKDAAGVKTEKGGSN